MKLIILVFVLVVSLFYFYFWYVRTNPDTGAFFVTTDFNTQCKTLAAAIYSEIDNANYCQEDFDCVPENFTKNPFTCGDLINKKEKLLTTKIKVFFYQQKKCPGYNEFTNCFRPSREEISCVENICHGPKNP